jgi:hypothetical protein
MSGKRKSRKGNAELWETAKHMFDPSCECADCVSKRGKAFQYIRLIPNLPDGSAGIYTSGEGPADTWPRHLHELELVRLGEGKGRRDLRQEAEAIRRVPHSEVEGPTKPTHSEDFTSVNWFGVKYQFTKGLQAESVRLLWEAWENDTPSLSEKTIGERAGSSSDRFRLEHVFKPANKKTGKREPHRAWGAMIVRAGKGLFKLADSESPK